MRTRALPRSLFERFCVIRSERLDDRGTSMRPPTTVTTPTLLIRERVETPSPLPDATPGFRRAESDACNCAPSAERRCWAAARAPGRFNLGRSSARPRQTGHRRLGAALPRSAGPGCGPDRDRSRAALRRTFPIAQGRKRRVREVRRRVVVPPRSRKWQSASRKCPFLPTSPCGSCDRTRREPNLVCHHEVFRRKAAEARRGGPP